MECENIKYNKIKKKVTQKSIYTLPQSNRNAELDKEEKDSKKVLLSPLEYIKQVTLNPEDVLRRNTKIDKKEYAIFTPNPKIIVFQQFVVGNVYNVTLNIRNTSQVPHYLRILGSENVYFNVEFKGSTLNTRLAPGMTLVYNVEFRPAELRDYFHDIIFKTDIGKLTIPVIAVGPRPVLAFPDQIDAGQTPINITTTKPILLQNIGDAFAGFSIFTDNPCFTATPSKGSIDPGKAVQVQVNFTPNKIGILNGHIFLRYESGDTVQSIIYGESVKCDIKVLEESIIIENTYLGLSRIETIEIKNNSDYVLCYQWMKYESIEVDIEEKERCKKAIDPTKDLPSDNSVSRRIYFDKLEAIENESFQFDNNHFTIFPKSGEVWPQNSTKVTITFQPQTVGDIFTLAYLEVDGLENRIPVSLSGKCIGPNLELNLLSLDVQEVYLCSPYYYEVVCKNAGPVPGTLMHIQKGANFGSTIIVEPCESIIDIDELKSLKLSFYSDRTGNFIERVDFVIKESSEILSFVMKGTVICPLIRTDEEDIEFFTASLGFTSNKQLHFHNLSHAPVVYSVKVPSDGYECAITHEEFATAQIKPKFPTKPSEFCVSPSEGMIRPQSSFTLQVCFTPNIARIGEIQIQIDLCKSANAEPLLIPISFHAKSAIFEVEPAEEKLRFCFLNFPYCRCLSITNISNVEGYFYIIPQEISSVSDDSTVLYSLSTYQGYLKPDQSKEILVTIIVKSLGPQKITLSLISLGVDEPVTCCEMLCNGEGPVVSVDPTHLDWGETQLLCKKSLTLTFNNDSPICAVFTTSMSKSKSVWEVEPSSGEIEPNKSILLNVSILLRDAGKYTDRLLVSIFNGKIISVNLSALGVGSSIVFEPEFFPTFDMGFLFSRQDISIPIKITNKGTRQHHVIISNLEKVKEVKKGGPIEEAENGIFKIRPNLLDLEPEESHTIHCKVRWNTNEPVSEPWYIYATIEGQGKRELLGTSTFMATFVEPNIVFDKNELGFRVELGCNHEIFQQEDEIHVTNQSGRDMNAHITVDQPILMIDKCNCYIDSMDITLVDDEPIFLRFYFPFEVETSEHVPQTYDGYLRIAYDEHKHIDKIPYKAEVHYPHLIFLPNEINMFCVTGWSTKEEIRVINDSPLIVYYAITWIKESFIYQSLVPVSDQDVEGEGKGENESENVDSFLMTNSTLNAGCICSHKNEDEKAVNTSDDNDEALNTTDENEKNLSNSHLIRTCLRIEQSSESDLEKVQDCTCQSGTDDSDKTSSTDSQKQIACKCPNKDDDSKNDLKCRICTCHQEKESQKSTNLGIYDICTCHCGEEDYHSTKSKSLSNSLVEIESMDLINKFLQITPEKGVIQPYSEILVTFTFNGLERAKISAQAICEVGCGSPKIITVNATADIVKCALQDQILDYGLQLYCESSVKALKIWNQCWIPLKWSIETSSDLLHVADGPEVLEPVSLCSVLILRRPSYPGTFNEKLFLEITGYPEPFIVYVIWLATIPQIFLDVPRNDVFEKYPVEFGYEAVQMITSDSYITQKSNKIEITCSSSDIDDNEDIEITDFEISLLIDDNWQVITRDERYPKKIDIDMAFERVLIKDVVRNNEEIFLTDLEVCDQELLSVLAPSYNVNINFVMVEQTTQHTILIKDYGQEKAKIKLRKDEKSEKNKKSPKSCFFVQLEKNTESCQCENTYLSVIFTPKKNIFTQRQTDISYKFSLEVKQGLIIPVIVKAIAVYPYVTINRQSLNFDKVFVGECREMCFLLKNEGWIDCKWEIIIENPVKNPIKSADNPFYIHYSNDIFIPGQEALIKVYYKPSKNRKQKRNLVIIVENGQEPEIISLTGYGIERKIDINKKDIKFSPIVPNETLVEENVIIENNNPCAVELYWQHLQDFSESNRIVRILKHYYRTDDILIPLRKAGEGVPQILVDFYNSLVQDMYSEDDSKSTIEPEDDISVAEISKSSKNVIKRNSSKPDTLVDISTIDPTEIETLLHDYIDKLQERINFSETMKDPLNDLRESNDHETVSNESSLHTPKRQKLIVIFYGAPFTEYQETACRTAKALDLPVLNLNQVFLEAIAFSETENAHKLAEQLGSRYTDLSTKLQKFISSKKNLNAVSDDVFNVLKRLPPPEEFERMDLFTYHEYKLEVITAIMDLTETINVIGTPRAKDKASLKSQDTTGRRQSILPGFGQDLYREILRERLSQPKFNKGYVLQTLNNEFIKNEMVSLKTLLEATGKEETYLFVTFYNSCQQYDARIRNLERQKEEEELQNVNEKLKRFEEMTQSEIDFLSEEDKAFYNELIIRKSQAMTGQSNRESLCKSLESRRSTKKSITIKSKKRGSSKGRKSDISKISVAETILKPSREESLIKKEPISKEIETNLKAINEYTNNLYKLLETISEWETEKSLEPARLSKSLKNIKGKDRPSTTAELTTILIDLFSIWHIRANDPWDREMYDATISQISMNFKNFIKDDGSENKSIHRNMLTRTYTVFKEYNMIPTSPLLNQIFCILPQPPSLQYFESARDNSGIADITAKSTNSLAKSRAWSSTPDLSSLTKSENVDDPNLDPYWSLQPNESKKFKLIFNPTEEGCFESEFLLSLVDNPSANFKINVEGAADIPRLDMTPHCVFDWIKDVKVSESHKPTYFMDSRVFDFGSLLIPNKNRRSHKKFSQFAFKNISTVPVIVSFTLAGKQYDNFEIEPRELEIMPDETSFINVTASASKLGRVTDVLMLSIKNNDQKEQIQLQSNGIELKFEFEPKQIQLERILLFRTEKRILMIKNQSAITLYWRLSPDGTETQIQCVPSQGRIKYKESCEIELHYHAHNITASETEFMTLEIFLNEKDKEPIVTNAISVTAECYEILFDIISENPIKLPDVPVDSVTSASFSIKNLGLYAIRFEIQFQEMEMLKKILDARTIAIIEQDFTIAPSVGAILPKKQTIINITYTPSIETVFKSVPLLKYGIIEPYKDLGTIKEDVLCVSTISYYTRYSIEPYPTFNFGTLGLKTTKIMQLEIANTGDYLMKYSILNQSIAQPQISETKNVGTASKRDSKSIKRSASTQSAIAKWGPFEFEKTRGELNPGEKDIFNVRCWSNSIGSFNEKLVVLVPDSLPLDEGNGDIIMTAIICTADIDFENYSEIFTESHIIDKIEEFNCPLEFGGHTIFSKFAKCLYFRRVCVGTSHTTSISLRNTSPVPGDVIIEIIGNSTSEKVFEVNTNRLNIPSMSRRSFTITFAPSALEIFTSSLNVKLDTPQNIELQSLAIDIEGEACVPQIQILEPDSINNEPSLINFGLTFVTKPCEKNIKIRNVGKVVAKVTCEIIEDSDVVYSVYVDELDCGCSDDESGKGKISVTINPDEVGIIKIQFIPTEAQKYPGHLNISIDKNPYEIINVELIGEGFTKPVIFENLEIVDASSLKSLSKTNIKETTQKKRKSSTKQSLILSRSNSKLFNVPLMYNIDYAKCFLNRMNKINFKIANKTSDRYFRFEWNTHPNVVCTPSAGHLAPKSSKDLTSTFLASEPTYLTQVPMDCLLNEILFDEPVSGPLWDTRQTKVLWMQKCWGSTECEAFEEEICMKKIVRDIREPEFQVVPGTLQTLQVLISAIADYSDYECDVQTIEFDDTLMFQNRIKKFTLKNVGTVNLDYSWEISMDEQYPIRLDQSNKNSSLGIGSNLTNPNKILNDVENVKSQKKLQIKFDEPKDSRESDLFSSSAGLTDRSTDTWMEGENSPFEITPHCGSLAPLESVECILKFSPIDVFEYKAYINCKIENLNTNKTPLSIVVTAKSLLPYCHFEIQASDYLTSGRRDIKLPGPPGYSFADPEITSNIKVVEFTIMGTDECHTRHIYLINPTNEDYCFSWLRLSNELTEKVPIFQCLMETGIAEKGKRTKIGFTTVPEGVGLFESFWQFEIKKYDLKTLFLIVANVVEPSISCRNTLIKLEDTSFGEIKTNTFEIINNESCPLSFFIKSDSLYSEGRFQCINIYPMKGILNPNCSQIFNILYEPTLIGEYDFNVHCYIEKLKEPINVYITARVIEIFPKVIYTDTEGRDMEIYQNCDNIIDIGQIALCKLTKLKFTIMNIGEIAFYYLWNVNGNDENTFSCAISESEGRVDPSSHNICSVEVIATDKVVIRNYPICLQVKSGIIYRIKLNASAKKPPLEFNFNQYDFGQRYIQMQTGFAYSVDLTITNHQTVPCLLKCSTTDNPNIKVDLNQLMQPIRPNSTIKIPIYFQPTKEVIYQQILNFSTTDSSENIEIVIRGEGIPYKIHLKNPCDAVVDIGTVSVGKVVIRKISVKNEGCSPVKVKAVVLKYTTEETPTLSHPKQFDEESKLKEYNLLDTSADYFQLELNTAASDSSENSDLIDFIGLSPSMPHVLKPTKEMVITVKFNAIKRAKSFKAKLGLEVDSSIFPFTIVKATCTSASLYLNRSYISFGTVYEACSAEEKLVLVNDGDIGTRFKWKTEKLESPFNIKPLSGYCAAGSEIVFTCIFKPLFHSNNIQSEVVLALEKYKNLVVNIVGNCCSIPEPKETLQFSAQIRESETKEMQIYNDTDQTWSLKPVILGDCFSTSAVVSIDPKDTTFYAITYKPKKETLDGDMGRLIIILPDGRPPILYGLHGRCTPATCSENIVRRVRTEKEIIETLIFSNNSDEQRTFDCIFEQIDQEVEQLENEEDVQPIVTKVDIPAKTQVQREFEFYFETEGRYFYKITFDDHRDNYQCYELQFEVTSPESPKVIELTTFCHSSVFYTLKIENPLENEIVSFEANDEYDDIIIHGIPVSLAPLSFKNIQIEYKPLLPCNKEVSLVISSDVLESTNYKLKLVAVPAPPQKTIIVNSVLGTATNFTLRLKNHTREQCEFVITVDDVAFTCAKTIVAIANEEATLDVLFEPYSIENVNATITAMSGTAGEFVFPVIGQSTLPQPQGPVIVTARGWTSVAFKNIFLQTKLFKFTVDSQNFAVNVPTAKIDSKKTYQIKVKMQKNADEESKDLKVGKLIVTCTDEALASIKWIYYLKGVINK